MKKIAALVLVFFILISSAVFSFAEGDSQESAHSCNGICFNIPLSGDLSSSLAPGNYYLTDDCTCLNRVIITGEVNICLNGHVIGTQGATTLQVENGGVLNLYDCTGKGHVGYTTYGLNNHPITINPGGTVNLYSVYIWSNAGPTAIDNNGVLNIYNSVIECNGKNVNGIAIKNLGEINIYGGKLIGKEMCIMQRYDYCSCVFHDGETILSSSETVMRYASDVRPVSFDSSEIRWKMSENAEYSKNTLPDYETMNNSSYLQVMLGEIPEKGNETIAEEKAQPGAASLYVGEIENDSNKSEKEYVEVPHTSVMEQSRKNTAMLITLIVIAAVSAGSIVILLIVSKIRIKKD